MKKYLFPALSIVLALALIAALFVVKGQKKALAAQQDIIELMCTYDYMCEEYLPDEDNRDARYILMLGLFDLGWYFEDEDFAAMNDLIRMVIALPQADPQLNEIGDLVADLDLWIDFRGGRYSLCGDVEALKAQVELLENRLFYNN